MLAWAAEPILVSISDSDDDAVVEIDDEDDDVVVVEPAGPRVGEEELLSGKKPNTSRLTQAHLQVATHSSGAAVEPDRRPHTARYPYMMITSSLSPFVLLAST